MSELKVRILIVDDEDSVRKLLRGRLERRGHDVYEAGEGAAALLQIKDKNIQVVVSDIRMPGMDGFELLKAVKVPTVLMTGHGDKESAIRAVEYGAFAFFEKPFDLDAIEVTIRRAFESWKLKEERDQLLNRLQDLCVFQDREIESLDKKSSADFVGKSEKILEIKAVLKRLLLKPQASLLILGETGTGKEVVARALHNMGHGSGDRVPFLALNCASIPTELFESELYGHEKGSFSGAIKQRVGLAEAVRDGTLFLDEIGEMDPRHQAKLLRLLQERKFRRVGSNSEIAFKGRIVAATHRDLKDQERFREDLYYRLSVVSVTLPPLRERRDDLPDLVEELCKRHGLKSVAPEILPEVLSYEWPGNIRELNNWLERAAILGLHDTAGHVVSPVPSSVVIGVESNPPSLLEEIVGDIKHRREKILDMYDRRWIETELVNQKGNISAAAKSLGLDRKNLGRRIQELGIDVSLYLKKAA